jgi:ABC-type bacteriocin/lantibiotic exporter with double-glycine peptidase domain
MPPQASTKTPPLREAFQQFRRLVRLIRPYWSSMFQGMVLSLVLGLLAMATPYLSKLLIDEVYPTGNLALMHVLVLGTLAVSVASAVLFGLRFLFTAFVTTRMANATSLLFLNHLQHLRPRFFDEHRVGEISSRFTDVRSVLNVLARMFETVFVNATYLVLVPPFMFLLQWKLALVSLVTLPVIVAITVSSGGVLRRYWKRSAEAYAELSALQLEVLSHIRTVKTLAVEPVVYGRASKAVQGALRMQLKAAGYSTGFGTLNTVVNGLGTAVFTWYAWKLLLASEMTLGEYVAFTAYIGFLLTPLLEVTRLFTDFQQTAVMLGRMFEYLDQPPEQDPTLAFEPPPPIRTPIEGDFELRGVGFGYAPDREVLHDVSVRFPRGTITSIVGPSGAGKSSLLRLLLRLEEPERGEVRVDGTPLSDISLPDLRRQLAVVWQEFGLMRGTLWENLTLGAEGASVASVDEAVRLCRLDSLVHSLPEGYETPVGEWGSTLSGGQRQRLALARALICDAPVLLLDEATSNVDLQTENEILPELFARMEGKTVIFVTHRVASAALAHRVVMVEAGRVVAVGTHAELTQGCEAYVRLQGGGAEPARRPRAVPQPT